MKKKLFILMLTVSLLIFSTVYSDARSGCCSNHGGVSNCDENIGRLVCNDGTYSPSCVCPKRSGSLLPNTAENKSLDQERSTSTAIEGPYKVLRVVDGDTIEVDKEGTKTKVRMLCVDTPESVHPAKSRNTPEGIVASNYTKEHLTGRWVLLEFEGNNRKDRYGRLLAYVLINYNVELIMARQSKYYTKYGKSQRYNHVFQEASRWSTP